MTRGAPILFATSGFEELSYGPVRETLERRGFPVVVYATDRVLSQRDRFFLEVTSDGALFITYDGKSLAADEIGAAWYWKVTSFRTQGAENNVAKQLSLVNEMTQIQHSIWSLYPEGMWLNSPMMTFKANHKLGQLLTASRLGFSIPRTIMSSEWEPIESALLSEGREMIVKMSRGVVADQNEVRAMYTTRLNQERVDSLRDGVVPFPGYYQPFVPKGREWRVTVVGDRIFSAAIYTQEAAKDDWRKLQLLPDAVQFRREALPDDVADLCRRFLHVMSLRYGAFDLIETPDGEIVFLECNPSGQFMWLEDGLGLDVSSAIADELIAISTKAQSPIVK